MLLARITEHVKTQNWFAVFIDFVVVVVGIFIGLQVSDWNQDRLDRKSEGSYLLALQADFSATAENLAESLSDSALIRADLLTMASYRDRVPAEIAPAELDRVIASSLWDMAFPPIQMDAYEDLKYSVGTKLLGSHELRLELSRFESLLERYETAVQDMQQVQYRNIDPYLADNFPMGRFAGALRNAEGLPPHTTDPPDYNAFIANELTQNRVTMKYIGVSNTTRFLNELKASVTRLSVLVSSRLRELDGGDSQGTS